MSFVADTHTHTTHSCDGQSTPDEMCRAAIERGINVYAIADHCDVNRWQEFDCYADITASVADAKRLAREYDGRMRVIAGIELGNAHRNPELAKKCAAIEGLDCIVGSVHRIILDGKEHAGTTIAFAGLPDEQVARIIDRYFDEIHMMLDTVTPDILAHPTYMLRYSVGYHNCRVDLADHRERLDSVLERVIDEGIALELNTQIMSDSVASYDRYVLERYYELGGRLVTLASDAHKSERVGNAFEIARRELHELGFVRGCWFENREIQSYEL